MWYYVFALPLTGVTNDDDNGDGAESTSAMIPCAVVPTFPLRY